MCPEQHSELVTETTGDCLEPPDQSLVLLGSWDIILTGCQPWDIPGVLWRFLLQW